MILVLSIINHNLYVFIPDAIYDKKAKTTTLVYHLMLQSLDLGIWFYLKTQLLTSCRIYDIATFLLILKLLKYFYIRDNTKDIFLYILRNIPSINKKKRFIYYKIVYPF